MFKPLVFGRLEFQTAAGGEQVAGFFSDDQRMHRFYVSREFDELRKTSSNGTIALFSARSYVYLEP